ncbi:HAMP domain-containing sensor histidine kinase [Pleionea sp. CnH1-48]|uniref:sensor histidine kinase n=1 Tax=Pleionea sp. CnH1-48 TaxID=2954494 RepID=UPI0020972462|nr:HAMP domain-containing sensor histidine kinase [Pleionea sp. CnH1-48]MCO7226891.1 HAMP domain-containing histidine kinase [Pleionea sp. CnH1-48]
MKLSLYHKLALTTFIVFFAMVGLIFWWVQKLEVASRHQAEQKLHLGLADHLVHDNPLLKDGATDYKALKNLFHTMMILGPGFEFYVLDTKGQLSNYSAKPGEIKRRKVRLQPILELLDDPSSLPIYGDDPRSFSEAKIFSAAPIYREEQLQGYMYVIVGGQIYDSVFESIKANHNLSIAFSVVIAGILFFFFVLMFTFRLFVFPLRRLTKNVENIRQAGFDGKVDSLLKCEKSSSEVDQLGCAFNEMIAHINQQFSSLQQLDTQRREVLSHISHDLRTPLASLQGYIETIDLRGAAITDEQRASFIKRALKNAQQLKLLVDQIFELAHIESGQVTLNLEPVNLSDLMNDLCDKFTMQAAEKNIQLNVCLMKDNITAKTDIGKLERVLSNLVENALRHTGSGGFINLKIEESEREPKRLVISVEDNGEGIAKEELPYIFDVSYRAENAAGERTKHIGLGLTITKKLLAIMNSEIRVDSELGKGTRFSFYLP